MKRLVCFRTKFVFVPSRDDLGIGHVLPRPSIPSIITEGFLNKVPTAVFASNPCRLVFVGDNFDLLVEHLSIFRRL